MASNNWQPDLRQLLRSSPNWPSTEQQQSLFALIIGINSYRSVNVDNLRRGVRDANYVQSYLVDELKVPISRIKLVLNESATRQAIISEFRSLQNNRRIKRGDPILVFFAGQGAETRRPEGWPGDPDRPMQMILPYDVRIRSSDRIDSGEIRGIPDRTVAALLDDIVRLKGDNITIICDCRDADAIVGESDSRIRSRIARVPDSTPAKLDRDIWKDAATPDRFARMNQTLLNRNRRIVSPNTLPLSALIIGIDQYENIRKLSGAVRDSREIERYLRGLGVPASRITCLRNNQATRDAIIRAFLALESDLTSNVGDPIVIYFAGHGDEAAAPAGWEAGGPRIQMIMPQDVTSGDLAQQVSGIPDRTIAALLNKIARAKGDNITVIFDSCHSASGTRSGDFDGRVARAAGLRQTVSSDLDENIWSGEIQAADMPSHRMSQFIPGFLQTGLRSHVLMAACGVREYAWEESGTGGAFTSAFLDAIRAVGADRVTYAGLLRHLRPLVRQNPQCEGFNQNRIFFDGRVPNTVRASFSVRLDQGVYILEAGAVQGVTIGAEFNVFSERDPLPSASPLGRLTVAQPSAFTSEMRVSDGGPQFSLPTSAFAIQIKAGTRDALPIYTAQPSSIHTALVNELGTPESQGTFTLVERDDVAELVIGLGGSGVVFDFLNPSLIRHMAQQPYRSLFTPAEDDVIRIVRAAAHFHWHLRRSPIASSPPTRRLSDMITLSFMSLVQAPGLDGDDVNNPLIVPDGADLNDNGTVNITVDADAMYGIRITSNISSGGLALYPYLFFFDYHDLSIVPYYQPPSAGNARVDPPLMPGESLTVGYGAGGAIPFTYVLKPGRQVDVGFLKLFLTTEYADLSFVSQGSAFVNNRTSRGSNIVEETERAEIWDTMVIPVVQRERQ